jgi:MFS family permease
MDTFTMRWFFTALLMSTAFSVAGNRAVDFSYLWVFLKSGGSGLGSGALLTISAVGGVMGSIFLTPLIDRFGAVRFSVAGDLVSAASIGSIALAYTSGNLGYPLFAALAFIGAMMDTVAMTARASLVPLAADGQKLKLASANGILHGAESAAHLLAAPIAAALLHYFGTGATLSIFGGIFVASALTMVTLIKYQPKVECSAAEHFEVIQGFRLLWGATETRVLLMTAIAFVIFVLPIPALCIPYYFNQAGLGVGNLAMVQLVGGIGGLVSGIGYGWISKRISNATLIFIGFSIEGLMLWGMGYATHVWQYAILSAASGLATGPLSPLFTTVLQERAPKAALVRMLGAFNTVMYAGAPLGFIIVGWQIDKIGVQLLFIVGGIVGVLTGIFGGRALSQKQLENAKP